MVAAERKVSRYGKHSGEGFETLGLGLLGFPTVEETTNAHLAKLEPFYIQLLQCMDKSKKGGGNEITSHLDASEDEAMLLLYVFLFPLLVRRNSHTNGGLLRGKFGMTDVATRIVSDRGLISWCRAAIAKQKSHPCRSVISSALMILIAMHLPVPGLLPLSKIQKLYRKTVIQSKPENEGFDSLRQDLCAVILRDDANADIVRYSIHLWLVALDLHLLYDGDVKATAMEHSLHGCRQNGSRAFVPPTIEGGEGDEDEVDKIMLVVMEHHFRMHRRMVPIGRPSEETLVSQVEDCFVDVTSQIEREKQMVLTNPVFFCRRSGCSNHGELKCGRCLLASYCSKECQVSCWKEHKKVCNHRPLGLGNVHAAAKAIREVDYDMDLCSIYSYPA